MNRGKTVKIQGSFKAIMEILIHEIQECKNMNEVHRLLDSWIRANNLHPEKVQTISEEQISQFIGSGPQGIYQALMEERDQERELERKRERSLGAPNGNNKT